MSAQLRQPARPEAPAGTVPASLEQQIMVAEMAILAREQRLRAQASRIGQQLHDKLPALGAGAASMVGGVVLRRLFRQRRAVAEGGGAVSTGSGWLSHLPWAQLSALVWPLLPLTVRNRANPKLVAALMATAVPLAVAHFKAARTAPVTTAPLLDLRRYAGRWYEIARLPLSTERECDSDVSASYTLLRNGRLRVVNSCRTRDGELQEVRGIARPAGGADGAKLEVCFAPSGLRWLPGAWAPYWVLHVAPDYSAAVVGTPDRKHLWLLSRSAFMDDAQLQRLLLHARAQGFDTTRLMRTPQGVHAAD
jgi:lipocalin